MPTMTSPAAQDYLKAIYGLGGEPGRTKPVSTKEVADRMGVSAASATNMLKRLADMALVDHARYRGVRLTDAGRSVALEVIRHHRLLETYLAQALGVPWDRVHEEAEVLEHVLSEDLEDRIAALLGHPTMDPHGHPIPDKNGAMPRSPLRKLWDVADGHATSVERVPDRDPEALRYLGAMGLRPGARVSVVERGPVGGPLFVTVDDGAETRALSRELAEAIWVS
jgi:DtxR family Mn-dependent transcriptional regulator